MKVHLTIISLLFTCAIGFQPLWAQQVDTANTALSPNVLTQEDFVQIVKNNHPLVKKAMLIERKGDLGVKSARGGFDPYLYNYFNQKDYKGTRYYSILNGGLKIPTWYGIEGKLAYDNTAGTYLNPENNLPLDGLLAAGVSVSLGKGMFIDERRKTLQKAKVYDELSELEQFNEVNLILYESINTYWDWVIAYNNVKVYETFLEITKERLGWVKKSYIQGAKPAIDTLEALIQVQNRQYELKEAQLKLRKTQLALNNYLWSEEEIPLEITDSLAAPEILDQFHNYLHSDKDLQLFTNFDVDSHPVYQAYGLKLDALNIEKRYRAEALKPKIDFNYNFLNESFTDNPISNFSANNYKLGLEIGFPIFLRKQRGEFQLSKVAISETEYAQKQKRLELDNKVAYYLSEIQNLESQERIFTKNTVDYGRLVSAERRKFQIGESSIFLINYRENKLIESQIKLVKLRGQYRQSLVSLFYTAGQPL